MTKLDADPKTIQQIDFIRQLKKLNKANNNPESMLILMLVLMILEKLKVTRLKFSQRSITVL